jgi:hypothetical protein
MRCAPGFPQLLLFFLVRPASVWLGLMGATGVSREQRILISWLGIRGISSIVYLMYAINHGLPEPLAKELIAITLSTVAASILYPRHFGDAADEPVQKTESAPAHKATQRFQMISVARAVRDCLYSQHDRELCWYRFSAPGRQ